MYIVQTESLCNQLEVRRAQSRQLRVCCAQNKGEHKIWNDCQKKEKLSDYLSLTDADPALLFFYYWNWEFYFNAKDIWKAFLLHLH